MLTQIGYAATPTENHGHDFAIATLGWCLLGACLLQTSSNAFQESAMKFVTSLLMSAALSVGVWGMANLAPQSAAIAQLPEGVSLDDTSNAEQQAIEMLRSNPQMVLQLVETTLQQNPQLLQYLQQNPQLVEQVAGQNSDLMQELQQHPELIEQLEDLLQ